MGCGSSSQAQGDGVPPAMPPTTAATSNTQTANEVPNGTTLATTTAAPAAAPAAQPSESAAAQPSATEAVAAPTAAPVDVPVVAAGSTADGSSSAVVIADQANGELVAAPAAVAVPTEQEGAPASAVPVVTTQPQAADEPAVVVTNPIPVAVTGAHPEAIVQQVGSTIPSVKPQAVFVLGGPGCGKGTQCAKVVKEFGWVHLSAGDLLREERERGGPRSGEIEDALKNGHIVPAEVTVQLLKASIESHTAGGRSQFLIDGFPRNVDNLQAWKAIMGAYVELLFVLYFDCTEATMRQRVLKRGESSGRVDDNEEALQKRFLTYTTQSRPVIARYEATARAVLIDANADEEHVWQEVRKVFAPIDRDTKPMPKKEAAAAAPAPAAAAAEPAVAPVATSEAAPAAPTDAAAPPPASEATDAAAAPVAPVAASEAAVAPEGTDATAPPAAAETTAAAAAV